MTPGLASGVLKEIEKEGLNMDKHQRFFALSVDEMKGTITVGSFK